MGRGRLNGALAALVSYPFVFEPLLSRQTIATIWAGGFALYATLVAACAASLWRWRSSSSAIPDVTSAAGNASGQRSTGNEESQSPTTGTMALWLALSACGSALLMSLTNRLCQDLAAVPFLWVLPLALYLVTFILCFERQAWYRRGIFTLLLPAVAVVLPVAPVVSDKMSNAPSVTPHSASVASSRSMAPSCSRAWRLVTTISSSYSIFLTVNTVADGATWSVTV